jgi:hypothetical protein
MPSSAACAPAINTRPQPDHPRPGPSRAHLIADDDSVRAVLCRRRLERILAIDAETADLKRQIADLVAAADTT